MNWFSVQSIDRTARIHLADNIGCFGHTADDLLRATEGAEDIEIFSNSLGGCSATATRLHDEFKGRVSVCTVERCGSAAIPIAMAAKRIRILHDGHMMLHAPSAACLGQ